MFKRLSLLLSIAAMAGGCVCCDVHFWPNMEMETVKPEYPLKGKSVAVVIFADKTIQHEYPKIRLSLGTEIAKELEANINQIKVASPAQVSQYQDENINWNTDEKRKIGKALKTDLVLSVSLSEYSTREPGQMNTYQGRIIGNAKLYETNNKETCDPAWETQEPIKVVFPAQGRYSANLEPLIRQQTESNFAEILAKKFYKHKVSTVKEP